MKNNIPIDVKTLNEIASILALGILRARMRESAANKALMRRKALDFRVDKSVPAMQECDNE